MVSKETQIFLRPVWLRWEPGLVRKSEVVFSTAGLLSLLLEAFCPLSPPLAPTLYPKPGLYFHFWPQQLLPSLFLPASSVSVFISVFVYTDLNIWESLQTGQK